MTTRITTTIDIDAPVDQARVVLADLDQWPAFRTVTATTGHVVAGSSHHAVVR